MPDDVWLVVGLGNPGPSYAATRGPSVKGSVRPDFCTSDETAAEPSVLR